MPPGLLEQRIYETMHAMDQDGLERLLIHALATGQACSLELQQLCVDALRKLESERPEAHRYWLVEPCQPCHPCSN